jgi:hypothetical protein
LQKSIYYVGCKLSEKHIHKILPPPRKEGDLFTHQSTKAYKSVWHSMQKGASGKDAKLAFPYAWDNILWLKLRSRGKMDHYLYGLRKLFF